MDTARAVLFDFSPTEYALAEQMKPHSAEGLMENHQEGVTASRKPRENSKLLAEKPKIHKIEKVV